MNQAAAKNGFSLERDLMPIMKGQVIVPNFEEIPLESGVATLACAGGLQAIPELMNAKVPGMNSNWGTWARFFLRRTQNGQYDGTGFVMFYDRGKGRVGKFAICEHKFVLNAGANPRRGWKPGHCEVCGLDMSVDSGD